MSENKLRELLKSGKDWGRMKTSISGVFVLKLPPYKSVPGRLAVEINPSDESGNPKKKRGLMLRSEEELEEFRKIIGDDRLTKLQKLLDSINPAGDKEKRWRSDDIIEI